DPCPLARQREGDLGLVLREAPRPRVVDAEAREETGGPFHGDADLVEGALRVEDDVATAAPDEIEGEEARPPGRLLELPTEVRPQHHPPEQLDAERAVLVLDEEARAPPAVDGDDFGERDAEVGATGDA